MRAASYSSLTQHRECPQKWAYSRLARLEVDSPSAAIGRDFGTWGHAWLALDGIRRGVRSDSLKSSPSEIQLGDGTSLLEDDWTTTTVAGAERGFWTRLVSWWKSLSDEDRTSWVEYIGEPAPKRLAAIVKGYRARWSDEDAERQVVAVELPWSRELPSGEPLQGVIDLVEIDTRRNVVVATDHKFKKRTEQSVEDDMLDSQLHLYAWGATPALAELGIGEVRAVAYDRIRTLAPKEPTLTASGGLSKSVTDYDLATYLKWAAGPDGEGVPWGTEGEFVKTGKNAGKPKFGRYTAEPDVVAKLSTQTAQAAWFDRTFSPLSPNVVRTHLLSANETAQRIPATVDRWEREGDAARNFTFGCKFCDFRRLCASQLVGGPDGEYPPEDYGLQVRSHRS